MGDGFLQVYMRALDSGVGGGGGGGGAMHVPCQILKTPLLHVFVATKIPRSTIDNQRCH